EASESNSNGSIQTMTYDLIGRPSYQRSYDSTNTQTREVHWSWDTDPQLMGPNGASIERVTRVETVSRNAKAQSSYHYDTLGRVDSESECIDAKCFDLSVKFDPAGRIKNIIYPDQSGRLTNSSKSVDYKYDDSGLLSSVPGYISGFKHDAEGH